MPKKYDLIGQKFGNWTVLEEDKEVRVDHNRYWKCVCDCGEERSVTTTHLRKGNSVSCRKCSNGKHKGVLNSRVWSRMIYRAKKYKYDVDVTKDYLYDLFYKKQKGKCALTGMSIHIANTIENDMRGETTASIDRIDSTKGCVKGNVQWVHKKVNRMKWDLEQDEFVAFCEAIVKHKKEKKNGINTKTT